MQFDRFLSNNAVYIALICAAVFVAPVESTQLAESSRVDVRQVTDEAEAVLAILAKKQANQPLTDADWQQLFSTEGYVRLKQRETGMQRPFDDAEFKDFVLSDTLAARAQALEETLVKWKQAEITAAVNRALAYLPETARIRAKIYPVIKPKSNSFVFEVSTDPAIFLYLDPAITAKQFENTLAHELHHIGYGSSCPPPGISEEISKLPENIQPVIDWSGAFGEGFAMLAAAGGPEIHPHAFSQPEDRARWDRDMANYNDDLKKVEKFFLDIVENRLNQEEKIREMAFSFFGVQGPWYTVGWKMAVTIENVYGRARLIDCLCDMRELLPTYNDAAAKYNQTAPAPLALWSSSLIDGIASTKHEKPAY
jgi:hypothetical protein